MSVGEKRISDLRNDLEKAIAMLREASGGLSDDEILGILFRFVRTCSSENIGK